MTNEVVNKANELKGVDTVETKTKPDELQPQPNMQPEKGEGKDVLTTTNDKNETIIESTRDNSKGTLPGYGDNVAGEMDEGFRSNNQADFDTKHEDGAQKKDE